MAAMRSIMSSASSCWRSLLIGRSAGSLNGSPILTTIRGRRSLGHSWTARSVPAMATGKIVASVCSANRAAPALALRQLPTRRSVALRGDPQRSPLSQDRHGPNEGLSVELTTLNGEGAVQRS